jgi:hypothetical protein
VKPYIKVNLYYCVEMTIVTTIHERNVLIYHEKGSTKTILVCSISQ